MDGKRYPPRACSWPSLAALVVPADCGSWLALAEDIEILGIPCGANYSPHLPTTDGHVSDVLISASHFASFARVVSVTVAPRNAAPMSGGEGTRIIAVFEASLLRFLWSVSGHMGASCPRIGPEPKFRWSSDHQTPAELSGRLLQIHHHRVVAAAASLPSAHAEESAVVLAAGPLPLLD